MVPQGMQLLHSAMLLKDFPGPKSIRPEVTAERQTRKVCRQQQVPFSPEHVLGRPVGAKVLAVHLVRADHHSEGPQAPVVAVLVLVLALALALVALALAEAEVEEAAAGGWPRGLVDGRH